jgi:type I restriction enzyme S subunit
VRDFPVRLPALRDQRALADYLDAETASIDAAIATRRRQSGLLNEAYDSLRAQSMLRGLDPVTGKGDLPSAWERPLLGVLIELHRGMDLPADARDEGPVPVVSSGGVSGRHSVAACRGPGVVTGRYGTVGDVYYLEEPFWPLNTTLFVSDFRRNDPRWVFHLLSVMPLDVDAEKSAVTGINRNVVGQLRAVLPPIDEQREIAAELDRHADRAANLRAALGRQVDLLLERRQALITVAVSGQLAIPGVAA